MLKLCSFMISVFAFSFTSFSQFNYEAGVEGGLTNSLYRIVDQNKICNYSAAC